MHVIPDSIFRRVDLHVHTPESVCYEDHMAPEADLVTSPEDIVNAAISSGLDAIAITDHNSAEAIDSVRRAAKGNGLFILPGIEISTRGGHTLAIFDVDTPVQRLRNLLADLGLKEEEWGDGFLQTGYWLDEVSCKIEQSGGLAIAAHIDRQPKGFAVSEEPLSARIRIHSSSYLSALELTTPKDKPLWNQGLMPNYPKRYACVQGSDAHAPAEIGRRPIYLGIPTIDLANLRLAFREYDTRVRFPDELAAEDAALL